MRVPSRRRTVELPGSFRSAPDGAQVVGAVAPDEPVVVRIYLKEPGEDREPGSAADLAALARPTTRRALARQRAVENAAAIAAITRFAERNGLTVRSVQAGRRCIVLRGTTARMTRAFAAVLRIYDDGQDRFRGRSGSLKVPPSIARWTRSVLGFDQRPQVKLRPRSLAGLSVSTGLWPNAVAALYGIPREPMRSPQCVGIIALGGGYLPNDMRDAAVQAGVPVPVVADRSVDGASNQYGGGTARDEEIALDMQVVAGVAPGAKIVVYFTQNTTASLAAALHQAVFDDANRPQVLSISWGSAEKFWPKGPRDAVQAALGDAVRLKVSVTVASGDLLATGGLSDGAAHVFFPSSSPYVLACGGTTMTPDGNGIASEEVWKENVVGTGGGISDVFPVPDFQANASLPSGVTSGAKGRGVPDVAAAASGVPGYRIVLGGNSIVKDGTSAVAPLWAAMIALANARGGAPLGLVNPALYADAKLFRPITRGDNRVNGVGYDAAPGLTWNACTGLGSPRGADIITALAAASAPMV
jgi:kumamolisin